MTVIAAIISVIPVGIVKYIQMKYTPPPSTQASAYMSFLKIKGTSLSNTSLITPPTEPVIVPMIIQTQKGSPASILLVMPTIVNKPSPIVSNKNKVLPHLNSLSLKIKVTTSATPVVRKYVPSVIQKWDTPSKISLNVPPPIAVTKPIMYAPNQSICLPDASRIPLIAKAKVPTRSRRMVKFISKMRVFLLLFQFLLMAWLMNYLLLQKE